MAFNLFDWLKRDLSKADKFARTIVSLQPPSKLKDMSAPSLASGMPHEENMGEDKLKIRFAQTSAALQDATMLVQKRYAWRGFPKAQIKPDPNRITITTHLGDRVVATVTVGYDSEEGLLVDEIYKPEVDQLRQQGKVVGELSKLAVDEELGSKQVMAGIINIAFLYGVMHKCTDAVIEVVPRHKGFYEKMLGFRQLGEERMNHRVKFPVVLMHLELAEMQQKIEEFGGKGSACGERSLYPYFFSQDEQEQIMQRLISGN